MRLITAAGVRNSEAIPNQAAAACREKAGLRALRQSSIIFIIFPHKKTRLICLGKNREAAAREYSENYKKLLAIVEEMTMINMTLLKENAWQD